MADFLDKNPGDAFSDYRARCLKFWEERYGMGVVKRVNDLVSKRNKKRTDGKNQEVNH